MSNKKTFVSTHYQIDVMINGEWTELDVYTCTIQEAKDIYNDIVELDSGMKDRKFRIRLITAKTEVEQIDEVVKEY